MKIEICDKCKKRKAKYHLRYIVPEQKGKPFQHYEEGAYCKKCTAEIESKYHADVKYELKK